MPTYHSILRISLVRGLLIAAASLLMGASADLTDQAPVPPTSGVQGPDAGEDIRGSKPLVEISQAPKPSRGLWIGGGCGLLLLLTSWIFWRYRMRARRRAKSPSEIALMALSDLEFCREALAAEPFANRAADALRQYIAARFGLAAPRRSTEEFLHELTKEEVPGLAGEGDSLRAFLKSCDLAKFAAAQLDASQRGVLVEAARAFIVATAAPTSNASLKTSSHD